MAKNGKNRPSVLNWLGSLILYAIPGVNIIFLVLTIIFAKSGTKRNFAIAGLILIVLCCVLIFAAFALFPDFFTNLGQRIRETGRIIIIP